MTKADALYLALIAIGLSIDSFMLWPRFLRRSEADPARARVWLWSSTIVFLWTLVALWFAAAASLIVFAAAHAYQGAKGVVAVGVVGGLFTLIVLIFGSLVPAIAVHMLTDAGEGLVAWLALRDVPAGHDGASGLGEPLLTGANGKPV